MTPPFLFSGHGIDDGLTPIYRRTVSGAIEILVDNSASQGIVALGGWIFPFDAVADHARLKIGIRSGGSDSEIVLQDLSASETHPPWRIAYIERISGTDFDLGGSGYVNAGGSCTSMDSHGRWVTNAGIARTVQRTTRIRWGEGVSLIEHACQAPPPPNPVDFDVEVNLTAIFSG